MAEITTPPAAFNPRCSYRFVDRHNNMGKALFWSGKFGGASVGSRPWLPCPGNRKPACLRGGFSRADLIGIALALADTSKRVPANKVPRVKNLSRQSEPRKTPPHALGGVGSRGLRRLGGTRYPRFMNSVTCRKFREVLSKRALSLVNTGFHPERIGRIGNAARTGGASISARPDEIGSRRLFRAGDPIASSH